ncbi:efflux RND transporter periplasmic adaptor subunit [Singulisphaera sp. Ch08]|uniref:Efflux RND transporter periplasmic adaptor subunit n=1 Tax=Singulisphaera sp. Ch08 TaxID=3120278 RepID=A0AAU7CG84_9BACT
MYWKSTIALVAFAGVGGAIYLSGVSKAYVKGALKHVEHVIAPSESSAPKADLVKVDASRPWNQEVKLTAEEEQSLGISVATVSAQTNPIQLELTGRTAYDPDTLTKIRPRFDTLVEQVHASLGQTVKKGEPLVELHSTELAAAKSDFQEKYVQWQHDLKLFNLRQELVKTGAISKQLWVDTINDEKKTRLEYTLARDRLQILKVPDEEIEPLLGPLRDVDTKVDAKPTGTQFGNIESKAKMTLVSPVDGIVIEREVVPQNFYETSTVLMVIAPLDHLWVLVNVYELDQDKVKVGQTLEIQFPFLAEKIEGKVQYVANEVSKETRAVKIRASIPNPGARLKSDMLVKAILDIPPKAGQTSIPRLAMVSSNGKDYVFVRKPSESIEPDSKNHTVDRFERRMIEVAQENHDKVIVSRGLEAGEQIVTLGSLILAQLYDDALTVATGTSEK